MSAQDEAGLFARVKLETKLAEAEAELYDWAADGRSYWNQVHGSQTGDYAGMFERTASADAAEIQKQTARVAALRLLLEGAAR